MLSDLDLLTYERDGFWFYAIQSTQITLGHDEKVSVVQFCTRRRQHGVDLTTMVSLVIEEMSDAKLHRFRDIGL